MDNHSKNYEYFTNLGRGKFVLLSELVKNFFNQLKVTLELPTPEGSSVDVIAPLATRQKNSDMSMISRDSNRKYIFKNMLIIKNS